MPNKSKGLSHFWKELKRRNVLRSLAIYAGSAFIILEAISLIFPRWGLPDWSIDLVLWLLIFGALVNVFMAWVFDITPQGIEKTKPVEEVVGIEKRSDSKAWKAATYLSLVVIVALIVFNVLTSTKTLRAGDIQSLVVLPFDNFTGDEELEYFVSGMHASLIGDMGKIGGLRVISKTSSNTYKDMDMSVPEIASELMVDAVVEATVMCLGDSICLQVKIISAYPEEKQLWIADYKEEKSQILNLYNRITKQIADEVRIELTPEEERILSESRTVDKDAYDAYLMGHYYWDDLSLESLNKALYYLNSAIEKDPGWAAPYAGLAQVWVGLAQMGFALPEIAGPKIFENINKALELDPDFADSHFINGIIAVWTEWNWEKGEKEFLQALAINPNNGMSRIYYAHLLMILQRTDEAITQGQLAADLDPLNSLLQALYAAVLSGTGDWGAALTYLEKALAIDPDNFFAHGFMDVVAYRCEEYDKAFEALNVLLPFLSFEEDVMKDIERIFREQGFGVAYEEVLHQMEVLAQNGFFSPFDLSMRYILLNQHDKAMDWIEKGFEIHDPNTPYITTALISCDQIIDNPRFIAILEKMNLSPRKE